MIELTKQDKKHMHWWNNTDFYNLSESDVLQFEKK